MNAVWWQIIVAVLSGSLVGGLLQGLPVLIRFVRRPRLGLYIDTDDKKTYHTRQISGTEHRGLWIAIWARNTPRCGRQTAKYCRPILKRIDRMTEDGTLEEEAGFVRDRLPWAGMGGGAQGGRGFSDRDVHKGDPLRISLGLVSEASPDLWCVEQQPTGVPAGRTVCFKPGTYRVTVRLYSDNADWTEKQFLVQHTGAWDQFSISDV
jgi:hypothetical protein